MERKEREGKERKLYFSVTELERNEKKIRKQTRLDKHTSLIKVNSDGQTWSPGSAGFDLHGNLSFMICDPMKLATSPTMKSSSTSTLTSSSTSSWKKNPSMQFGIPIYIIYDWLNQNWEGNLDDLVNKPKLPIIRLMSTGQKSEHSCSSFTKRQVFKTTEDENEDQVVSSFQDEIPAVDQHLQGIPIPKIYETPKLTSGPFRKTDNTQIQFLDINFPPRINMKKKEIRLSPKEKVESNVLAEAEIISPGSVNGAHSEVQSCASPIELQHQGQNGYSSEGEITMYSAETAESRNFPSLKEGRLYHNQVGRSQSCVNYSRNQIGRRGRNGYSQGTTSQRSNDYYSPTVSSIMKKQNNSERQVIRHRPSATRSPKWTF